MLSSINNIQEYNIFIHNNHSYVLSVCSVDRGGSDEVTNRGWSDEVLLKP